MIIRVKEGFGPFKFSGRGLVLRPGDNSVNPDAKLLVLLKRGAARGKWEIDPPAKAEPVKKMPEPQEVPEEKPGEPFGVDLAVDGQPDKTVTVERVSKKRKVKR